MGEWSSSLREGGEADECVQNVGGMLVGMPLDCEWEHGSVRDCEGYLSSSESQCLSEGGQELTIRAGRALLLDPARRHSENSQAASPRPTSTRRTSSLLFRPFLSPPPRPFLPSPPLLSPQRAPRPPSSPPPLTLLPDHLWRPPPPPHHLLLHPLPRLVPLQLCHRLDRLRRRSRRCRPLLRHLQQDLDSRRPPETSPRHDRLGRPRPVQETTAGVRRKRRRCQLCGGRTDARRSIGE